MQLSPQVFSHLVKLLTYPLEEDVLTKQEKNTIKRDIYIYIYKFSTRESETLFLLL